MPKSHCLIEIPWKRKGNQIDFDEVKKKIPSCCEMDLDAPLVLEPMDTDDPVQTDSSTKTMFEQQNLDVKLLRKIGKQRKEFNCSILYWGKTDGKDTSIEEIEENKDVIFWDSPSFRPNSFDPWNALNQWYNAFNNIYNTPIFSALNQQAHSIPTGDCGCLSNPWVLSNYMAATRCGNPVGDSSPCGCCQSDYWGLLKGTIIDVANTLQANQLWQLGYFGNGTSIGMVGAGVTAIGRPWHSPPCGIPLPIPNVVGGYPENNWGTIANFGGHEIMTSSVALGMAPQTKLYDIRIVESCFSLPENLNRPIRAYHWITEQIKKKVPGFPRIFSNSWAVEPSDQPKFSIDPNHPLTRMIRNLVNNEDCTILFAAINCGSYPPLVQCRCDFGPGKSIWGANGDTSVMTISAANIFKQYLPYSSVGPAEIAPHAEKPDFCGISNFWGFSPLQMQPVGTSASTPTIAGIVALLREALPEHVTTPHLLKDVFRQTATQICGEEDWNAYTGYGVVQAGNAYQELKKL